LAYNAARSEFYAASADTTKPKEEKKEQVRKGDRRFEAQPKGRKEQPPAEEEEEKKEGGFWDQCGASCMDAVFESICGAVFGGDSETKAVVAGGGGSTVVTTGPGAQAVSTPEGSLYEGMIRPLEESSSDVTVWETPGGDTTETRVVETLPRGAHVAVMEEVEIGYAPWVRIKQVGGYEKTGWVRQEEVVSAPTTPAVSPQVPMASGGTGLMPGIGESRGQLGLAILFPVFGEETLRDEYAKNAWRLRAESKIMLAHSIQVGASMGYLRSNGELKFVYEGETTTDSPVKNTLEIWDFGVEMGHLLSFAGGKGYFVYGVGPSVFNVQEKADIDVIQSSLVIDTRTDKLSVWKLGGEIELGVGGLAGGRFPIGFQTRLLVFPWESKKEESLTLDHLKKEAVFAFSFGMSVGVVFF
jgi:hypothetical protein